MNRIYYLSVLFVSLTTNSFSQDSLLNTISEKKQAISAFITPSVFYLEPGVQFQYFLRENSYLELKYSFSLFNYNFYNSGYLGFENKK